MSENFAIPDAKGLVCYASWMQKLFISPELGAGIVSDLPAMTLRGAHPGGV